MKYIQFIPCFSINISLKSSSYTTRNASNIPFFKVNNSFSKIPFLHPLLLSRTNYILILKIQIVIILLKKNILFDCHNPKALKFMPKLHLGVSHLRYYKFKRKFQKSLNPLCNFGLNTIPTSHYPLEQYKKYQS